jgi:hypothetical protein
MVLRKIDGTDYNTEWAAPSGGSGDVSTDTIWDAKGDLVAGTGANTAIKVTAGANEQVLKAASGQTTGLIWGNAAYGDRVGTPASPETSASAARPTTSLPVLWIMAAGILPTNAIFGDVIVRTGVPFASMWGNGAGDYTSTTSWAQWAGLGLSISAAVDDIIEVMLRVPYLGGATSEIDFKFQAGGSSPVDITDDSGAMLLRHIPGVAVKQTYHFTHQFIVTSGMLTTGITTIIPMVKHVTAALTFYNNVTDPRPFFSVKNLGDIA